MYGEPTKLQKFRFFTQTGTLYLLTILFALFILRPLPSLKLVSAHQVVTKTNINDIAPTVISGLPYRILIPNSSWAGVTVNLLIDPGFYNASTDSWTLSGTRAQFSMYSSLANNYRGETYIYGHNNDSVFGALRHNTPIVGSNALLYTTNGRVFTYSFVKSYSVGPNTPSVLNYNGSPILVIQTCTGSFNEARTLYVYNFVKVS